MKEGYFFKTCNNKYIPINRSEPIFMQTIMDLTQVSYSYPICLDHIIKRDNIIELIEEEFITCNTILLNADSESGKTIMMREYCEVNPMTSISIFVDFTNNLGYDLENIKMDLCNQINWILKEKELSLDELNKANLNSLIFSLNRYSKNNNKKYTFVIDGLENAPKEKEKVVENILQEIFPLHQQSFNFLITDNLEGLINKILLEKKNTYKEIRLPGMTLDETKAMFEKTSISKTHIEEIRKLTKGKPGLIRNFKRLLDNGADVEKLLNDPDTLPDFFNLEWEEIKYNELLVNVLSIIVFDQRQHSTNSISKVLNIEEGLVRQVVKSSSVIYQKNNDLELYSRQFRNFLKNKLDFKRNEVINSAISQILEHESYDTQMQLLPEYYLESNRYQEFLSLIDTEEHYAIIEKNQSMAQLSRLTEMGYNTSQELGEYNKSFRFSIQNSIILQNYQSRVWHSEISTLIAINDFEKAIVLANRNGLIEDRLHMLAIIAKEMTEKGYLVEKTLKNQIETLYEQLDVFNEEKVIDIASQLIYTNVELAIELIEKSVGIRKGENAFDYAVAKVSLSAMDGKNLQENDEFEKIKEKVKDPSLKKFFEEFYLFVKNQSSVEILSSIDKFESQTDRITILSNWCVMNKSVNDGIEIVKKTFEIINMTSKYSPNAGVYHKLSKQLPYIDSIKDLEDLIKLFESQDANIEKSGPRIEYIQMKINIIHGLKKIESSQLSEKIEELYIYISDLKEITLKSEGMALIYSMVERLKLDNNLHEYEVVESLIRMELEDCVNQIISESANQFEELRLVINSLSEIDPQYILKVIGSMNTVVNRERSYYEFLISISGSFINYVNKDYVVEAFENIKFNNDYLCEGLLEVVKKINETTLIDDDFMSVYGNILEFIPFVEELEIKCMIYCHLYGIFSRAPRFTYLKDKYMSELISGWEEIDIGWRRVDIGFKISTMLSNISMEDARKFVEKVEECRETLNFYDSNFSSSYVYLLRLLIKTYNTLVEFDENEVSDYQLIKELIDAIPSRGERAILWSEIALIFFQKENYKLASEITRDHVYGNIEKISDLDRRYKYHVVSITAPSMYYWHKNLTLEMLEKINYDFRELALHNIANYIFTKHSVLEPYDNDFDKGFVIKYEELLDLCEIISYVKHDSSATLKIVDVLESLDHRKSRLTKQQVSDIKSRIREIIEKNFPMENHILHEGYKVVCLSYLYKSGHDKARPNDWKELIQRANDIPNLSDRIFTKIEIASNIPTKQLEILENLIDEIENDINDVNMILDKVSKYEHLAKSLVLKKKNNTKQYLKNAMQLTINNENEYGNSYAEIRKSIIDLSYRVDSKFAESLVSLTDDDPVRQKMKEEMNEELSINELKTEMINEKNNHKLKDSYPQYSYASWKLLASLNANRIKPLSIKSSMNYLNIASKMPLTKSYPIYSWIISNARVKNTAKTDLMFLRDLFKYMTVVSKFSLSLNAKGKILLNDFNENFRKENELGVLIRSGERDIAIEYICKWFEEEVEDYLLICDPYFGPNELEIINELDKVKSDIDFTVFTSKKHQKQEQLDNALEEVYFDHWKYKVSEQLPPSIKIIAMGTRKNNETPLHDRWLISKHSGLRLGTSLNSMGFHKDSEISKVGNETTIMINNQLNGYLSGKEKEHKGDRLLYNIFTL